MLDKRPIRDGLGDLSAGRHIALFGEGDQPLRETTQLFGLDDRRADFLMHEQAGRHVSQHGAPV